MSDATALLNRLLAYCTAAIESYEGYREVILRRIKEDPVRAMEQMCNTMVRTAEYEIAVATRDTINNARDMNKFTDDEILALMRADSAKSVRWAAQHAVGTSSNPTANLMMQYKLQSVADIDNKLSGGLF